MGIIVHCNDWIQISETTQSPHDPAWSIRLAFGKVLGIFEVLLDLEVTVESHTQVNKEKKI